MSIYSLLSNKSLKSFKKLQELEKQGKFTGWTEKSEIKFQLFTSGIAIIIMVILFLLFR